MISAYLARYPVLGGILALLAVVAAVVTVLVGVLAAASLAHAADASVTLDFAPILASVIDIVLPVLAAALTGVGGLAIQRGFALLGLAIDARQRAVVEQVLDRAVSYGLGKVGGYMQTQASVTLRDTALAEAAAYAVRAAPQALAHFKATEEPRIRSMLESRLTNYLQHN
jgi:hypothetical protein